MAEDNSILSDDEMDALEGLLAKAEEIDKTVQKQKSTEEDDLEALLNAAQEEEKKNAPKLKEDESFAKAMTIEVKVPSSSVDIPKLSSQNDGCDSSDDEDVKNFLERKYNEYGKDINKNLKQASESKREAQISREIEKSTNRVAHAPNATSNSFQEKPKAAGPAAVSVPKMIQPKLKVEPIFTDPVFGYRIINPLISSQMLSERMNGRKAVAMIGLRFHIDKGDHSKDWVIAGVVVSKSPVKQTKNGKSFSIWKLSDLKGEIKMMSLFLFQSAHSELWKTAIGMVVAILNPNILDNRMDSTDIAALSIDNSQKVMILGQSKDLGKCKSRKKNGEPCGAIVNLHECDYCIHHVKAEFGKFSKRTELQSSTAGRGLDQLRNKVLGKSEVFYGGQSFTAIPAKKSAKQTARDNNRLSILSDYNISPNASSINHTATAKKEVKYAARGGPVSKIAEGVQTNREQRIKDLELLQKLKAENEKLPQTTTSSASTSSPSISSTSSISTPDIADKWKGRSFSLEQKPQLSKSDFTFDLGVSPTARKAAFARSKAAELLKKKPIAKSNPNMVKYRGTEEGVYFYIFKCFKQILNIKIFSGKRRAIDELNDKFGNETKKRKIEEDQREKDRKTRIERIMAATSSHKNLVEQRHDEEQEKYFSKLEKKEAMEEKMLNTFQVDCKAVICQQCKYTAFSAADRCKEEKHPLKVINATKRFFQCKDCGNRTATVHKLPKFSCKNCQGSKWERAAMIKERKVGMDRDQLCIRGDEETFLGSLQNKGNINLLVPDES